MVQTANGQWKMHFVCTLAVYLYNVCTTRCIQMQYKQTDDVPALNVHRQTIRDEQPIAVLLSKPRGQVGTLPTVIAVLHVAADNASKITIDSRSSGNILF